MKRAAGAGLKIDVVVDSEHWTDAPAASAIVRRALRQAANALSPHPAGLAIVLTDDRAMRLLNRKWRGVDAPTNVLSFAIGKSGGEDRNHFHHHLGDIVLAYQTIKREARREDKPFNDHLAHLAVHGFLHLLGYDHQSPAQARRMESTERAILRALAVPDPYAALRPRAKSSGRPTAKRRGKEPGRQPGRVRARPARNA
jgi:probable rRNA maturation factor